MIETKPPVVLIGVGEMGGVFARGLLRAGHPVYPLTRNNSAAKLAQSLPAPAMVLVAVGENELLPVLEQMPAAWADSVALLQNELLPKDWQAVGLQQPTVISVWFEKKPGKDPKVIIPSPVFGPAAVLLEQTLGTLELPVRRLLSAQQLLHQLVLKNLYILTTNIAGLRVGGTVGELWSDHQPFARAVAADVLDIQQALTGAELQREALIDGMVKAFNGDLEHGCMGRSALARLLRAVQNADALGLGVPTLREILAQR